MIVQDGLRRMLAEQEDVFYYLTLMNENYPHPAMPEGAEEGILRGHVPAARGARGRRPRVQLLGSGTILREVLAARRAAARATSASPPTSGASRASPSCARDGIEAERWNLLHPTEEPRRLLRRAARSAGATGPVVAATDYMRAFADQIRPVRAARRTRVLGTDGFGRSDYRVKLRRSSRSTATTSRSPR